MPGTSILGDFMIFYLISLQYRSFGTTPFQSQISICNFCVTFGMTQQHLFNPVGPKFRAKRIYKMPLGLVLYSAETAE